ncbi:transglycosylase domain-containing protein [Nocardioides sp. GY 10113]|uniref:penicillin-binding protein n=1 Tax=Nocardioides sp. GY 10113 TaxID=2569761 RepID=UPI001F111BCD|nr:transglycosylase domain-containing protein [Nocardioides sp. GY 10113]
MIAVSAVLGVVVSGLAIPFAGVVGLTARNVASEMDKLPKELATEQLPQRTEILDKDGQVIATLYDQNRVNVPLRQMSRPMVKAILAIEDYRFYQHGALDLRGTLRALLTNQAANGVVQGGSSITQQLVKQTLINQADGNKKAIRRATDDSYARKIRELRYAIALEKRHTKDWILEQYLNTVYFGDGAYGIQAAAQHFFGVNAKDLNLRQSALLAGLVRSPEALNPTDNAEGARDRRNVVLYRMAELSVIPDRKAQRTAKTPLGLDVKPKPRGCVNSPAQFFCDYVVNYLMQDKALGANAKARERLLWNGGLTVRTTIDMKMQTAAQNAVKSHVFATDSAVGATALVVPRTGEVRALAQSKPMGSEKGQSFLNFTVPKEYGDANGFQPGSNFKPFVLAAAIDQGIPLTTTINSPAQMVVQESKYKVCDGSTYGYGTWDVKNFDGANHNPNLYTGTQLSVNTFFAQLEMRTGLCEPYNLAKKMGVRLGSKAQDMIPSFTLGPTDASPLEMAEAYATFAGRGLHCDSRPVTSIEDAEGNVLKKYEPKCNQVLPASVADAVNDVLEGVTAPGGFGAALSPGIPSAGKTGTSSGNNSVWFTGYTPNLAGSAVVAGVNSAGSPTSLDGVKIAGYYRSTSGSTTAGPIWGDTFKAIAQDLPGDSFTKPSAEDIKGVLIPVPSVAGQSVEGATAILEDAGFGVANGGYVDSSLAEGTVAYTEPGAGTLTGSGSTIVLKVSDGTPYVAPKPPKKNKNNGGNNGGGNGGGPPGNGRGPGRGGR